MPCVWVRHLALFWITTTEMGKPLRSGFLSAWLFPRTRRDVLRLSLRINKQCRKTPQQNVVFPLCFYFASHLKCLSNNGNEPRSKAVAVFHAFYTTAKLTQCYELYFQGEVADFARRANERGLKKLNFFLWKLSKKVTTWGLQCCPLLVQKQQSKRRH